ncbi:hypothetical protein CVT24_007692, partial [Panaeolus cyanescens]
MEKGNLYNSSACKSDLTPSDNELFSPEGMVTPIVEREDYNPNERTEESQCERASPSKRPPLNHTPQQGTPTHRYNTYQNPNQMTENIPEVETNQNEDANTHNDQNNIQGYSTNQKRGKKKKKKPHRTPFRTRAYLKMGTLNINGGGSRTTLHKWENINQIIREDKIDILAIQETHITEEKIQDLHTRYPRLYITNSRDEEKPNAMGVAIVLNRHRTRWRETRMIELKPGRAIIMSLPWKQNETLNILVIYAPNNDEKQAKFWEEIHTKYQENPDLPKPDIMMGDFNLVEDAIDRYPPHRDYEPAVNNFQTFKLDHNLQDAWRREHPDRIEFTYSQFQNTTPKSQSRLDRIYMKGDIVGMCYDWQNKHPGICSDHKMVTTKLEDPVAPFIGKGRWAMPHFVLRDKTLMNEIKRVGNEYLTKFKEALDKNQIHEANLQESHEEFKHKVQEMVRNYTKTAIPKLEKLIKRKDDELKEILKQVKQNSKCTQETEREHAGNNENKKSTQTDLQLMARAAKIEEELLQLHIKVHLKIRDEIKAKFWREAETIGKPWINVNKDIKPRDTIYKLKFTDKHGRLQYATKSEDMADKAAEYHNNLQKDDSLEPPETREEKIKEHIDIIEKHLSNKEREYLEQQITKDDIKNAIMILPNGKSPGLNGITTEFYKKLMEDFDKDTGKTEDEEEEDTEHPTFDIITYLQIVLQDFTSRGPSDTSNFAEGWMCPIYKKNDKTDIANYRPITVLNTNYKILTRAMTTKLSNVVHNIIHPDQAGFMKKRSIADHTDLVHMLTYLCNTEEKNGAIICLDQEKAYDKIKHEYLWLTLEKFGFPEKYIQTIKHLYSKAETL